MAQGGRSSLINFDDNFLAAPVNDTQTTIQVTSDTDIPTVPFYLVIDPFNFENYEVLYCTEVAGFIFTVVRNLEGTKGTTHSIQVGGDLNPVRFAYAKQQLDDLWDAVDGIASNLTVSPFIFDSAITNTPAAGHWGRNNTDLTLATELFFNKTDEFGFSVTTLMGEIRAGDDLFVASRIQEGDLERHITTDVASLIGDVYVIPVKDGTLTGVAFTDQTPTKMTLLFGRSLALGGLVDVEVVGVVDQQVLSFKESTGEWVPVTNIANKGITSLDYLYDANQDTNPPSGDVSPDNATPSLVTNLAVSNIDANGNDFSFVLANIKAGDLLVLQQKADGDNRENYEVVSNTDQGSFRDIEVTPTSDTGTISDNDPIFLHTLAQLPDLDAVYLRLDTTNDPLTGALSLGSNKITSLADGTADTDAVSKLQSEAFAEFEANEQAIKRMRWENVWAPGTYETFDVVFDQLFAMVANKQTSDRAAPQPVGQPFFLLPDDGSNWDGTDPSFVGQVTSSNRYTFARFGVIQSFRVYIPEGSDNTIEYRAFYQDRTDPNNIIIISSPVFTTAFTDRWITVNLRGTVVNVGSIIEVGLITLNSATGTDDTFQWNSIANSNPDNDPGSGNLNTNNADTQLRINNIDDGGTNRITNLTAITPGTTITVSDAANPLALTAYQVITVADNIGYFTYGVSVITSGLGGYLRNALTNVKIQIPVAQATEYVQGTAQWGTIPSQYTAIVGHLITSSDVTNANAYGSDIQFLEYAASPDWDILSFIGGGGGGGDGSGGDGLPVGGTADQHLIKIDDVDFNSEWRDQLHLDLTDVTTDQHHPQVHAHDGADGSGTVAHSATTGRTADDHHNQVHAMDGSDHTGDLDPLYLRLDSQNDPLVRPRIIQDQGTIFPGIAGVHPKSDDINLLDADTAHFQQSFGLWRGTAGSG